MYGKMIDINDKKSAKKGGSRPNSGNKKTVGGKYGENSLARRIPESFWVKVEPIFEAYKSHIRELKKYKKYEDIQGIKCWDYMLSEMDVLIKKEKYEEEKYEEEFGEAAYLELVPQSFGDELKRLTEEYKRLRNKKTSKEINAFGDWVKLKLSNISVVRQYKKYFIPVAATPNKTALEYSHLPENSFDRIELEQVFGIDPNNYYFLDVSGDSMIDAGISDGDSLVVKMYEGNSLDIKNGEIIVASVNNSLVVKIFHRINERLVALFSANSSENYETIYIPGGEQEELIIQGRVVKVIHTQEVMSPDDYFFEQK
ncbi:LexA family protein [Phormidium tenue]|uniref:Peptidase S24/S26A/S26B/S26C domain-containing protein n=1 Tax=Phormidium tenue NIES-30 TaxID=549789 RepID=A0A1U7IYA6_9CYAN|nr:S24 family peptidase [Phormidium tenue]MBD2234946.1 hypothetical protein [Phormidium tenue FACHB-1052]OKH43444.1 hypothetical protein NIES30_24855 [Phormidium tenue NIES-30]